MATKKTIPIPTIRTDDDVIEIPHYLDSWTLRGETRSKIVWLDETPVYEGWLYAEGYVHGRSSSCYKVIIISTEAGEDMVRGQMTCAQFFPLIARVERGAHEHHGVYGKWIVRKRGQNYLIEAAE